MKYGPPLAAIALLALTVSCGDDKGTGPTGPEAPDGTETQVVAFADTGLTAAVRAALHLPVGDIGAEAAAGLTELEAGGRGIVSLDSIGHLSGLLSLSLRDNAVADIGPLASLTALRYLNLENNQVSDILPLASLVHLQVVILDDNQVADISPLLELDSLTTLSLRANPLATDDAAAVSALRQRGVSVELSASDPTTPADFVPPADPSQWRIIYVSLHRSPSQVYALQPGDREPTPITCQQGLIWDASVSPDGRKLVYSAWSDVEGDTELYLLDADTGTTTQLTFNNVTDSSPAWSPDGALIAFHSYVDGQRIAYVSGDEDGTDIMVMARDGSGEEPLTWDPTHDTSPRWSPDGRQIVYSAQGPNAIFRLTLLDLSTGARTLLTDGRATEWACEWVPTVSGDFTASAGQGTGPFADQNLEIAVRTVLKVGNTAKLTEKDLLTVTRLESQNDGIQDLAGVELLKNLETLIASNWVDLRTDESGRPTYDTLTTNTTWGELNQIRDLTPLAGLEALKRLELRHNPIRSLSPLESLVGLRRLAFSSNEIADLSVVTGMSRLWNLTVGGRQITELAVVSGLTELQSLAVVGTVVSDLSPLAELPKLAFLTVAVSEVSDLSPLAGLSGLVTLMLEHNRIQDIGPLAELRRLSTVSLRGNPLSEESLQVHVPALRARGVRVELEPSAWAP